MSDTWETGAGFIANGSALTREDDKLIVYFYWHYKEIKSNTEGGVPDYKDVEFVEVRQAGAKDPLYNGPVLEKHRAKYKNRYDAWKATRENPVSGLPLEEWPLITKAKVMELKARGIRTVQELSNVPDSEVSSLMLYGSQTRQKARDWLDEGAKGGVVLTLRKENEDLKASLEYEKKRISFLESQVAELKVNGTQRLAPVQQVIQPVLPDISAMIAEGIAKAMATKEPKKTWSRKKKVVAPLAPIPEPEGT